MTVIAWDGKQLVADSQATFSTNGLHHKTVKIELFRKKSDNYELLGGVGVESGSTAMKKWYQDGAEPSEFPKFEHHAELIVVSKYFIYHYSHEAYPSKAPVDRVDAWGSGGQIAIGLMLAGKTAKEACEIVCEHSVDCSGPLVVLDAKRYEVSAA